MSEAQLRQEICAVGASIHSRGLTHGATGNISVRLADGWLMTPTGSNLGNLDPDRLSRLDGSGKHIGGDKPTKENFLHLAVYDQRPGSGAVVHLHATHSVAVSVLADLDPADLLPPITAYYVMRIGKLPLVPFYAPGDAKLAEAVRQTAREHHATGQPWPGCRRHEFGGGFGCDGRIGGDGPIIPGFTRAPNPLPYERTNRNVANGLSQ